MEVVRAYDLEGVKAHSIGEFRGDFTRHTFDPRKHFLRVLMQQGRVLLDSDFNEQSAILLHYIQTLATDLIGPHGGPADHLGFEIISNIQRLDELKPPLEIADDLTSAIENGDFVIGKGRYYVDGVLCENEQYVLYTKQPYLPPLDKPQNGRYLFYLDVWERHITANEDDSIREVALGGPDTATRSALIWQVKTLELQQAVTQDCDELLRDNLGALPLPGRGKLSARTRSDQSPDKNCTVSPESRYRGTENQLYRVEIHQSGTTGTDATFKWSRDNGSGAFAIVTLGAGTAVVTHLGKDSRTALKEGDWVEVVDDHSAQRGSPGPLFEVDKVEPLDLTGQFSIKLKVPNGGARPPAYAEDSGIHPLLRRWDSPGAVAVSVSDGDNWTALEDGIEIRFHGDDFRTTDYWLIPARTATGSIEWPQKETGDPPKLEPVAMPPHGVTHHYAPLGIVMVGSGGLNTCTDCRYKFKPLRERSGPTPQPTPPGAYTEQSGPTPQPTPPSDYTYRRRRRSETWHFCTNCVRWPETGMETDIVTSITRPALDKLCKECLRLWRNDRCETNHA